MTHSTERQAHRPTRRAGAGVLLAAIVIAASLLLAGCTGTTAPSSSSSSASPTGISVGDLIQLGIASADAGDVTQATATFRTVLTIDPGNSLANYNLGVIAQQGGDAGGALTYYDSALATDPSFTSAMYNKAIILEATDIPAAIALYQQIVGIDGKAATAFLRLSLLLDRQGDTAGAADARNKALALDPSLAAAIPTPAPVQTDEGETPTPTPTSGN